LPPDEYFELINEICCTMTPLFRKYYGTHGKHAGDGLLYYFFPQPDSNYIFNALCCAREIKAEMRKISKAWQLRKNWLNELYLNIGLTEGQEWLGTFQSATSVEFVVLGDSINQASRISDFARYGAVWATKSVIGKLSADERAKVRFGVTRSTPEGREVFVPSSYALVSALLGAETARNEKLRDIGALPVTEIVEVLQ
jgi:adenylate cyclase